MPYYYTEEREEKKVDTLFNKNEGDRSLSMGVGSQFSCILRRGTYWWCLKRGKNIL